MRSSEVLRLAPSVGSSVPVSKGWSKRAVCKRLRARFAHRQGPLQAAAESLGWVEQAVQRKCFSALRVSRESKQKRSSADFRRSIRAAILRAICASSAEERRQAAPEIFSRLFSHHRRKVHSDFQGPSEASIDASLIIVQRFLQFSIRISSGFSSSRPSQF